MKRLWPIAGALLLAAPLSAQGLPAGTITFAMTVRLPDSIAAKLPTGSDVSIELTAMSDGHRLAFDLAPSPSMPMVAGVRARGVFTLGSDTIHVGVMLPPELAAMAGGGPGIRIDLPLSLANGAGPAMKKLLDSAGKQLDSVGTTLPHPQFRSLGTSAIVAGISCQEWEITVLADTTRTCVIPTPPILVVLKNQITAMSGVADLIAKIPGAAQIQKEAYGGKEMIAIRTVNVRLGMRMELVKFTLGPPDPSLMVLPDGLQAMPLPAIPGKPGGNGQQ